jgi:cell division protein FtsL
MRRINILLLILLIGSFLMRLVFANWSASQSYEMSEYTNKVQDLKASNDQLALSVAELRSIERLTAVSNQLSLVKADHVMYLEPRGAVAINR